MGIHCITCTCRSKNIYESIKEKKKGTGLTKEFLDNLKPEKKE